jgi:dethiobiotin synthetase
VRVAVVGVATEIGKTWTSARVLETLRAGGVRVAARKPVQSFDPAEVGRTDADVLAAATGEAVHDICPAHRWYPAAMAPPMAADLLDMPRFTADDLLAEIRWSPEGDVTLVETVGGVRSPLSDDTDSAQFARLIEPDVVLLVADAGLGTINAVRLALQALDGLDTIVHLNRYDDANDLHRRNLAWLTTRDRLALTTTIAALAARLDCPDGAAPAVTQRF